MTRAPLRVPRSRATSQRGAAVLLALFITTLATLIVASLFWSQFALFRTIENQELAAQSRLLLRGAVDWARAILREDQRSSAQDSLAEPWSQGLAATRLDQLGETSELARRATIAGAIEDAQGRLNLRNLVGADGGIDERELAALRRLADLLNLPAGTAELIAERMRSAQPPTTAGAPPAAEAPRRPLPLLLPQDLVGVDGIDPAAARALAPFVVVLDQPAPVNVNTAPAEVIAARVADLSLAQARALVASRERLGYFRDLADVRNHLRGGPAFSEQDLSVTTRYFIVRGEVTIDRATTRMEALLRRGENAQVPTTLVWQRDL